LPTSSLTTASNIINTNHIQLHLAMRADNTPAGLSILAECTTDVRLVPAEWSTAQPGQVRSSDSLIVGTTKQLRAVTSSVSVAGVDLPVADDIKVLEVVLDRRLSFHKHVSAVAQSCNYHTQAIRHIQHLLTTELAQTLACSLILSRIDYCNAVLHGAPSYSIKRLQRVENNAAQIVLEAPRRSHASPLLRTLHWLPFQQKIEYKVALLTFKVRSTSTPSYLQLLIQDREHSRNLRSNTTSLCQPFTTTTFAKRAF